MQYAPTVTVDSGELVVIVGLKAAMSTIILKVLVVLPTEFAALTEKLYVPANDGVPDNTPVLPFKLKPLGRLPAEINQVIGVDPLALSV
jgi:hypothetical protein